MRHTGLRVTQTVEVKNVLAGQVVKRTAENLSVQVGDAAICS